MTSPDTGPGLPLEQQVEGLTDTLEAITEQSRADHAQLEKITADVEALTGRSRNRPPRKASRPRGGGRRALAGMRKSGPLPWWHLPSLDAADQARLTADITEFGEALRARYRIIDMPAAWPKDPAYRAEILALFGSYRHAYTDRAASPNAPNDWHEALARFIARAQAYNSRAHKMTPAAGLGDTLAAGDHTTLDTQHRPTPPSTGTPRRPITPPTVPPTVTQIAAQNRHRRKDEFKSRMRQRDDH